MKIYILIYPALFAVGFLNGALRELTYGRYLGEYQKHAVGTLVGIVMIGAAIYFINYVRPFQSRKQAFLVGTVWAALTVLFESAMVLLFMKRDFNFLLSSYNITEGQLWPFVLLFVLVFPVIIARKGE